MPGRLGPVPRCSGRAGEDGAQVVLAQRDRVAPHAGGARRLLRNLPVLGRLQADGPEWRHLERRDGLPQGFQIFDHAGRIEFQAPGAPNGWLYSLGRNDDPSACSLWHKLGWDPALIWLRRGEQTKWIFVPGDGSEDIPFELDVGG